MPRTPRYRLAFSDWYAWLPYRATPIRTLQSRAKLATARGEAVVIVTAEILDQWRHGAFASPLQLQQASLPR